MEAQLRKLGSDSKVKILKLPKECKTKIWLAGRGTSCQIYTKSKYASRQHFSITYREEKYFISDLQSANGTFLNDEKLTCERVLSFGSVISVGVPSQMQNSPDCIVYVFESYSGNLPKENETCVPENNLQTGSERKKKADSVPETECIMNVDEDPQPEQGPEESFDKFTDIDKVNNVTVEAILNDSSSSLSSDIILIEPPCDLKKGLTHLIEEHPKPAKRRKLEKEAPIKVEEVQLVMDGSEEGNPKSPSAEDDDVMAYEALTQVDEPQVKQEPDLLNYSQTEELIEISDSEDNWCPNVKQEGSKSPEGGDEDDDVVFIKTIIREPRKSEPIPVACKIEDDLTETDIKWMGKLLKMEKEDEETVERTESKCLVAEKPTRLRKAWEDFEVSGSELKETTEDAVVAGEKETRKPEPDDELNPCAERLSRLSTEDIPEPLEETLPRVEVPKTIVKRVLPRKSVTFDLVPQIRYFEVPSRTRLTASEIGRMRFTRIIFNICNWNSHWLEECKRVAPEKDPPDICEERLRKIPKKFPCHSDYMKAFVPAMLLHLWNKIKDKWVGSGCSGFRQTLSCDSSEDYHTEHLSVYRCTGLVQSVNAHKQLLREGQLVLLRLHQVQLPQFSSSASDKYSKKLGYLVFGFVESKAYERFQGQPLHQSLAERTGSVVGDLHVVRLAILVKKRPNFKINKQKLIQLTVVQNIIQELRLFRGICFLPDSPLCPVILKPSKVETPLAEPENENIVFKGPLDDVQREVVRKLSHACFSRSSLLHCVSGAAGTGKGTVVMGLLQELLFGREWGCRRPKIIFCTQWSIPLDEMVVKLKNWRRSVGEPFNLVRVGPVREVKPEVREFCVSNLASNLRNSNKRGFDARKFDPEVEVFKEADVICTTCISAGISKMCSAFEKLLMKEKNQKVICIIDEAMSSREADSVVPLLLGVTHLILVGDINQFEPPFSGEKTNSLGLDMSLFWRIYKNFVNIPRERWPIFVLKTQYRMCSGVSKFISELVYKTPLLQPAVCPGERIGRVRSHVLLVDRSPETVSRGEKETREVRIVCQVTKAIAGLVRGSVKRVVRIALITCDTKQTESLQSLIPKTEFPEVEIDKIQAFQGRELDAVVFFYDGRKLLTSWVATALTRARSGLFVFASESSIKGSSFFQKMADLAKKEDCVKYVNASMTVAEFEEIVRAV